MNGPLLRGIYVHVGVSSKPGDGVHYNNIEAITSCISAIMQATQADDLFNPATFIAPALLPGPSIVIEFCDRASLHISNRTTAWLSLDTVSMVGFLQLFADLPANLWRCFRLHRASWTSTELFLTFPSPAIKSISLQPLNADETAGRFRVWIYLGPDLPPSLVWDRKVEGGFPELKILVSTTSR